MTSGLPPEAAVRRRAGAFVPPAVASVLSLPVWLVFVRTVLLSVVLWWCRVRARRGLPGTVPGSSAPRSGDSPDSGGRHRGNAPRRATVSHSSDKAPGATRRGRAVTENNIARGRVFPGLWTAPSGSVPGAHPRDHLPDGGQGRPVPVVVLRVAG